MTIRIIRTATLGLPLGTIRTFSAAVEAALVADKEAVYDTSPAAASGIAPVTADASGNLYANGQPFQAPVSGAGNADFIIDFIASGLALPTSGPLTGNSVTSGVTYQQGARVVFPGQLVNFAANSDNYQDALPTGVIQVSSVSNGAGAPPVPVNGFRLGYSVTNGSAVTSAVTNAKDSLGNWMGNRSSRTICDLGGLTNQSATAGVDTLVNFGSPSTMTAYTSGGFTSVEMLDNQGLHSTSTNSHRIAILKPGPYVISGMVALGASAGLTTLAVRKNANLTAGVPTASVTPSAAQTLSVGNGKAVQFLAGDFVYLRVNSAAGTALTEVQFSVTWAG